MSFVHNNINNIKKTLIKRSTCLNLFCIIKIYYLLLRLKCSIISNKIDCKLRKEKYIIDFEKEGSNFNLNCIKKRCRNDLFFFQKKIFFFSY